jgi:hypothetical protein
MHGGNAGRKPMHGRYSKAAKDERRRMRALLRSIKALVALGADETAARAVELADEAMTR